MILDQRGFEKILGLGQSEIDVVCESKSGAPLGHIGTARLLADLELFSGRAETYAATGDEEMTLAMSQIVSAIEDELSHRRES